MYGKQRTESRSLQTLGGPERCRIVTGGHGGEKWKDVAIEECPVPKIGKGPLEELYLGFPSAAQGEAAAIGLYRGGGEMTES